MINITIDKIDSKKIYEKLINILLNILIVLFSMVLIISLYTTIQVKFLGHKYANFFGYSMFEIQSDSMADELMKGDWIIVKLTNKVKIKDVVTYENKGAFITHRIVEVYKGTYITKGDANNAKDEPIDQSQIIGKLSKRLGNFGLVRKTLLNPVVLVTLIITVFLFNSVFLKKDDKTMEQLKKVKEYFAKFKEKIPKRIKKEKEIINENVNEDNIEVLDGAHITENLMKREQKGDDEDFTREISLEELNSTLNAEEIEVLNVEEPEVEVLDLIEEPTNELEESVIEVKEEETTQEIIDESSLPSEQPTESLDETSLYRVINVDLGELNETKLEIAVNEMEDENNKPTEKQEEAVPPEEDTTEEKEDNLTDIELKDKTKINKNMINTLMNIKREELSEIIWTFDDDGVLEPNEPTIKEALINTYINARYYNFYGDKEIECRGRSLVTRIEKAINLICEELSTDYKGKDKKYKDKVKALGNVLKIVANLDQAKDSVTEMPARKEFYKKTISEVFPDWNKEKIEMTMTEIMRIQKSYVGITKYFFKKLETDIFYLDYDKIPSKKDWYVVDLRHRVEFDRIYSDYVIQKTYKEGIIAEDKISVLMTLLSRGLIDDMENATFNKKYIVYIPRSLYKKERKVLGLLKLIEDEYAKAHVMILITLPDLKESVNNVKKIRKAGFKFATAFEEEVLVLNPEERELLYLVDAIFVGKDSAQNNLLLLPDDLKEMAISDNVIKYVDDMEEDSE